jgi:tetratricopeptide (TPR) repeat protein
MGESKGRERTFEAALSAAGRPKMGEFLRRYGTWLGVAVVCLVGVALTYPHLVSLYHIEAGGRALKEARVFRDAHPHDPNPSLDRALSHFQRATEILPDDGYAYRRLGQAWLLAGNNEAAREALERAVELRPDHPLIHVELGYAYDGLGKVDKALREYEAGGYGPAVEAAIANYLKVADWQAGSGSADYALKILKTKVLVLDEYNLPALYRMIMIYEGIGEQAAVEFAEPLRERLRALPVEDVTLPTEPRLVAYTEQAIAALVAEGMWTQEKADEVLSQ